MSTLLEQASLVLIPSGYKEDVVYSQIPTDGAGDLSFTRASNGTRINSAGLVEVCPWNLLTYSEDFSNAAWNKNNTVSSAPVVTANDAIAPNGTTTADKIVFSNGVGSSINGVYNYLNGGGAGINGLRTASVWLKSASGTPTIYITTQDDATGGNYTTCVLSTEWQRFEVSYTTAAVSAQSLLIGYYPGAGSPSGPSSSLTVYAWGAQINYGELKPYFPTTDRLNVPRLTYQNGGGGCPSLLLEKQSTNLVTYSEQFDNASWGQVSATITANTTISPDGTQDGDTFTTTGGGARIFQTLSLGAGSYTTSIYVKKLSGSGNMRFFGIVDGSGVSQSFTPADNWQRFTGNFTASTGITEMQLREDGFSGSLAIWGFQLEASSYPTSYIPTTSSSATRVADACFKTGISSLIGQTEGVLFADVNRIQKSQNYNVAIFIGLWPSVIDVYFDNSNQIICIVYVSGVLQTTLNGGVLANGRHKIAVAYKQNDFVMYVDGAQVATSSSGSVPTCSQLIIGNDDSTLYHLNDSINEAVIFPTRLTNAELASITTI